MQTIVQVLCSHGPSLRGQIGDDPRIERFGLVVSRQLTPGRPHGWAKIHSPELPGAVNVEWHADSGILTCRVVTKGSSRPGYIIGALVNYLLTCHRSRVRAINVIPR